METALETIREVDIKVQKKLSSTTSPKSEKTSRKSSTPTIRVGKQLGLEKKVGTLSRKMNQLKSSSKNRSLNIRSPQHRDVSVSFIAPPKHSLAEIPKAGCHPAVPARVAAGFLVQVDESMKLYFNLSWFILLRLWKHDR